MQKVSEKFFCEMSSIDIDLSPDSRSADKELKAVSLEKKEAYFTAFAKQVCNNLPVIQNQK